MAECVAKSCGYGFANGFLIVEDDVSLGEIKPDSERRHDQEDHREPGDLQDDGRSS